MKLILSVIIYFGIGALLLNLGLIQRLFIFPGSSIKHGETDEDNSKVSSDGPIILYENGKIIKYQINPNGNSFSLTKDSFKFQLKDSLQIEPTEYVLPAKMLVISDIEGNFKGFKSILVGNSIIDNNLNWTFGKNHLVLVGDFFDRGLNV